MKTFKKPIEFEWDIGNSNKNEKKHRVTIKEIEETFMDQNQVVYKDVFHSQKEDRFIVLGKTVNSRLLYIVFTIRYYKVRVISARDINKRRCHYMKKKLVLPDFKNEDEERDFWSRLDLSEYFESEDFEPARFPNLKPTTRSISIRIPEYLLDRVKVQANALNIPYQSLIKQYINKGVMEGLK